MRPVHFPVSLERLASMKEWVIMRGRANGMGDPPGLVGYREMGRPPG